MGLATGVLAGPDSAAGSAVRSAGRPAADPAVQLQIFTEGASNAFLVGSVMMLLASTIIWTLLGVRHEELATDGPEGIAVH